MVRVETSATAAGHVTPAAPHATALAVCRTSPTTSTSGACPTMTAYRSALAVARACIRCCTTLTGVAWPQGDCAEGHQGAQRDHACYREGGPHHRQPAAHVRSATSTSPLPVHAAEQPHPPPPRACRQLLEDREVTFSGYRVPHPLEPAIQVKVQTRSEDPGPVDAVRNRLI